MARRQVSIFINGKEVANQIKSVAAAKVKVNNQLKLMTRGTTEYNKKVKELRKLNGILKKHNDAVRGVGGAWHKITGAVGKFAAVTGVTFAVSEIINYGKELFKLGSEMEVLEKKAATVFGTALPKVTEEAEKNATAMGLTTSQYIDAAAAMCDLLIPMKFTRDEAANISTSLVNLSGALSEWTGGQRSAEEVSKILSKALLGEREQLKELGISILESDVKARLAEKGLKGLTGEMLQQAKAAATLELITEKTADAQAAYAAYSETKVRKQAELSAKFRDIKETMATALIPVFTRLLEIVEPVVSTFFDFIQALFKSDIGGSKLAKVMKVIGIVFRNAFKILKPFNDILVSIGLYLYEKMAPAFELIGTLMVSFYNTIVVGVNKLNELMGFELRLEKIDFNAIDQQLKDKQKELKEKPLEIPVKPKTETDLQQEAAAARAAKERKKAAARKEKETQKNLERIRQIIAKHNEEIDLAQLSDDEQKIQKIRNKYAKEIALAKDFSSEKAELERLLTQDIESQREEFALRDQEKQAERGRKIIEGIRAFVEEKKNIEAEIKAEKDELELSEKELAIQAVESHYLQLLEQAAEYGINTTDIEAIRREQLAAINAEYDKKDNEQLAKAQAKKIAVYQTAFKGIGDIASSFYDILSDEEGDFVNFQKGVTLAQIALDTASAISSLTAASEANPLNAITVGGAGIAQFVTGLARILANIAKAKKLLTAKVPQKYDGGWMGVVGADDNISYQAKYIGQSTTGMLPNHPVLMNTTSGSNVLASERGREYFVSNDALRNPYVLNYVQAIDNIVRNKTKQFAEGGSTGTAIPTTTPPSPHDNDNNDLVVQLNRLNDTLENGIFALLDDQTVIDIFKKFNQLDQASGGGLSQ